jgi:hypothetical protein
MKLWRQSINRLVEAEVHHLVVVDEDDVIKGIVSLSDILQAWWSQMERRSPELGNRLLSLRGNAPLSTCPKLWEPDVTLGKKDSVSCSGPPPSGKTWRERGEWILSCPYPHAHN